AIQSSRHSRNSDESETGEHAHAGHDHHHDCLACAALEKKKKGAGTWLALAVGVVPCIGALLVLLFGVANDLLFGLTYSHSGKIALSVAPSQVSETIPQANQ
ncbi:MAG: hypothetical protein WBR56_18120, partial [Sedimenticolaceae bacterium]